MVLQKLGDNSSKVRKWGREFASILRKSGRIVGWKLVRVSRLGWLFFVVLIEVSIEREKTVITRARRVKRDTNRGWCSAGTSRPASPAWQRECRR